MFWTIARFEWRYWFKNPAFYIYAGAVFLLAMGSMSGSAGALGAGSANLETIANSPWNIFSFSRFFNKILFFLVPAVVGASIFREFSSKVNAILFTYAFTKSDYLCAKFFSSFTIIALIALMVELGLVAGTLLPFVNPSQVLNFEFRSYLHTYFLYLLPNLFLCSCLVFASVSLTRNVYSGFVAIILTWLFREIWFRWTGNTYSQNFIGLTDPFGETFIDSFVRYWTVSERNLLALPLPLDFLLNRLIWLGIGVIILFLVYRCFSFGEPVVWFNRTSKNAGRLIRNNFGSITRVRIFNPMPGFGFEYRILTIWRRARIELSYIVSSGGFLLLFLGGGFFLVVLLQQVNPQTDTRLLPVTWSVLGLPVFFFTLLIQALTFFYAGVILNRPKLAGIADLIHVTPVSNFISYISALLTLVLLQLILSGLIMGVGIGIQLYHNFYPIEPGHYFFNLICLHLPGLMIWAILALFIQTLFHHTYFGFFVLVMIWLAIPNLDSLGMAALVFKFNQDPYPDFFLKYSDLSHFGNTLRSFYFFKSYWFLFGILLGCLTLIWWQRAHLNSYMERIKTGVHRFRGVLLWVFCLSGLAFLATGYTLFNLEKHPDNIIGPVDSERELMIRFEENYGHLKLIKQPRIRSVFIQLDLFPETRQFTARGTYRLVNHHTSAIDTLLIKTGFDEITVLAAGSPWTALIVDSFFKFSIYKLESKLEPGDSISLKFELKNKPNALLVQQSNVLENGTYLKSDMLPRIGYFATGPIMLNDSSKIYNHYQSYDEDLVDFEIIMSTSRDQTAIAPGKLIKVWEDRGRQYFHYKMNKKIKLVLGFNSGRYSVYSDQHRGVDLKIFHHPTHTYCLSSMINGLKSSLDYNTSYFGSYPHQDIKIIEFSRAEGSYATTAGNVMPISEIRFIQDIKKTGIGQIDLAFYVAAHELTHQWWGNQVIPADAPGAPLLTESITEYITAKIYEKTYGKKNALKFIDIQLKRYLNGRGQAPSEEFPLIFVSPEQSYISYGKGAVVFYTLSEYLGEEKLNLILQSFFNQLKNQPPPYPTSLDLINHLKQNTPDSLGYLIKDMFETVDPAISLRPYYHLFPDQ